ncbi:FAD-binding oxidoreductase [Candidatus Pseudothioglobus sp. Uisw_086]|uniref:FAD-binding oxidoreductase n=1 Tax=Candidatus Pseudothioglobus sp. Uisw_086 TaxID=3230998 RepID=UPI003A8A78B9
MSNFEIKTIEGDIFESADNTSILNCALSSNIIFEYSCDSGRCGACKANLIKGEISEIKPQLALNKKDKSSQFLTCCCEASSDILIDATNLSALQGIEIKILPARINSLTLLSEDIIEVKLRVPPTSNFIFLEGQHVDIIGPNSMKRAYSMANTVSDKEITFLIKKVKKGVFSNYWFKDAQLNDLLRIQGPKGTFFLRDRTKSLVFLATGTGIAPIIAILKEMDNNSAIARSEKISLFWGNREEKDFIWHFNFNNIDVDYHQVVSRKSDTWKGEVGYVQDVAIKTLKTFKNTNTFACGSIKMINAAKYSFIEAGLDEKDFYSDAFVENYNDIRSEQ